MKNEILQEFLNANLVDVNGTTLVGDDLKEERLGDVTPLVRPGLVRRH